MFVTTQISTNATQTTAVVAMMPAALTMWAASRVPVYLDTPEMDSSVLVIYTRHTYSAAVTTLSDSAHLLYLLFRL